MKSTSLFLIFLVFLFEAGAQDKWLVDSLSRIVAINQAIKQGAAPDLKDSVSANILLKLSKMHWGNDSKKAIDFAQKSLRISEKIGFKKGMGNAFNSLGTIHSIKGEYQSVLPYYQKALKIRRETGDLSGVSATLNNIGNLHLHQGRRPEALKFLLQALKIDEMLGDKDAIAMDCGNIGALYIRERELEEARKMLERSLHLNLESGNNKMIASDYQNLGTLFFKLQQYQKAEEYYSKAIRIQETLGQKLNLAGNLNEIGNVHYKQGKYARALENYRHALDLFKDLGNTNGTMFSVEHLGWVHIYLKKPKEAKSMFSESLELSKITGYRDVTEGSYRGLAMADSMLGDYESALRNQKMAVVYRDSLLNNENTKAVTEQRMQFEFDKKETALKFEKQLTAEQLEKQKLLAERQKQEIGIKEQAVELANKEKDLAQLSLLKEKIEKENKSKQLILSQKETELQKAALKNSQIEIERQTLIRNSIAIGFLILIVFSAVVFRQRVRIAKEKKRSDQLVVEKEMLMKEIHHRVKNNLEVISSLLELQSDGMDEGKAKSAVLEGQSRVKSIALIHHKLYRTDDVASVEFRGFVTDLFKQIESVFRKPNTVLDFEVIAPETNISIDSAVPLGLIINELLTNTFKYAIGENRENKITIELNKRSENGFLLVFRDNGPGLPADYNMKKSVSLGMKVIQLLTRQLGGKLNYFNDRGSVFEVPFVVSD